jgi:hypothetical protein
MATNKKSFLLYCDLIHTVEKLTDAQAGVLFKHILMYVNDMNPETKDIIIELVFEPIKQALKRDLLKYEKLCERNRLNGLNGGRPSNPKKPTGFSGNPKKPKKADIDNDSGIDTDTEIEIDIKKEKPIKENEEGISMRINNINYDLGTIRSKSSAINFIRNTLQLNEPENKKKIIEKINLIPSSDFSKDIINALVRVKGIIEEVLIGE